MKLEMIAENMMAIVLGNNLGSMNYFNHSPTQLDHLYNPLTGHDSGSRVAGQTYLPTGIPHNPRHRKFLGFQQRPGSITL